MEYYEKYKYYIDLNFYIIKNIYIHLLFSIFDFIFVYLGIIDGIHCNFNNDKKETLYSLPNIFADYIEDVLSKRLIFISFTLYLLIYIILYSFYNNIFYNNKFIKLFINFNEILHMRFLTFFYFAYFSRLKGSLLFAAFIFLLIFLIISINHFEFYHCDFFCPDFISIPYDNFSKIFDQSYTLIKFLIPFALTNQKIKNLVLAFSYSILSYITLLLFYLIIFKPIYFYQNLQFNIFRTSCHFIIFVLTTIFIIYKQDDYLTKRVFLIETIAILGIIILSYQIYHIFPILKLTINGDLNIYYFFHMNYSKKILYKLIFTSNYCYHFLECQQCLLCYKLKIISDNFNIKYNKQLSDYIPDFSYFQTLTFIMENYTTYGFLPITKNKKILILILTTIKNKIFEKNYIHQYLTLLTIYKTIAKINENEMEKVRMLMSELHSVNDFLKVSFNLLNNLDYIFQNENQKINIEKILDIVDESSRLKNKKFKKYLFNNKEIKEVIFPLTICSILYEEIFNETLTKSNLIQIRERYQEMEDTLNLFDINKQITFKFNVMTGKIEFLRSGQEFYRYIGKNFYDIFPKELYEYQKKTFQSLILNPPNPSKDSITKAINSTFIIKTTRNKNRLYGILHLNFNILFQNKHFDMIILDGYYYLTNNNFITYIKNNEEFYYGGAFTDFESEEDKKIINFNYFLKKNGVQDNEIKLLYSIINLNNIKYNIYSYGHDSDDENDIKQTFTESRLETTDEKIFANMRAYDESSVQGSLASITSVGGNNNFNLKGRRNVKQQKEVNDRFFLFQRLMIIFIFVLFVLTIIELITKQKQKKSLIRNSNVFTSFRLVSRTYYYMTSAFRANTCLILKNNLQCKNYIDLFNKNYKIKLETDFDIKKYLTISNELKIREETDFSNQFWKEIYQLNDRTINSLFEQIVTYLDISNINKNGFLSIINMNTTFSDAFKKTINAFTIVASSYYNYTFEPFFIIDLDENRLLHYFNVEYRDWRINLYNIIINYENFCYTFDSMNDYFHNKILSQINIFKKMIIIYLLINLFIEFVEVIVIIFYLYNFEAVMLEIYFFLKKRVALKEFRESFRLKIRKLKLLLQVYTIHPKIILDELNNIYSKFKKNLKEERKNEKKKNSIELSEPPNILKNKKDEEQIFKSIQNTYIFVFYKRIYQITFIISIIIFSFFLLIWLDLLYETKVLFQIINDSSQIESLNYQYFSFYQGILFTTNTVNHILNSTGKNLYELNLYYEKEIYKVKREESKIENILNKFNKKLGLTCNTFYNSVQDSRIARMDYENPNEHFFEKIIKLCSKMKFLDYGNIDFVMQKSFGYIYRGLLSLIELNEDNREYFFTENTYYFDSCYYNNLLIRIFRTGINNLIFSPTINYYMDNITLMFTASAIVEFVFEITFLLIIMFLFVFRINKIYKKLLRVSKVVKVCKSNN